MKKRKREASPPEPNPPKVYGYARVSTFRQTGRQSIDTQRDQLRLLAERNDLGSIDQIFIDEEESGGTPIVERPAGRELCYQVSPGDVVLLTDLDRAFRSVSDALDTLICWHAVGIRVIIQSLEGFGTLDISTPIGEFFLTVLVAVKKLERNQRVAFVQQCSRDAKLKAEAEGWDCSSRRYAPVGFDWTYLGSDRGKTRLIPYEFDLESMSIVAVLRDQGRAYDQIRDEILPQIGREKRLRAIRRQIGNKSMDHRRYEIKRHQNAWQWNSMDKACAWCASHRQEQEELITRVASNHPEWANQWGLGNYVQGLATETNSHDGNGLEGTAPLHAGTIGEKESPASVSRNLDCGSGGADRGQSEALARSETLSDGAQSRCHRDRLSDEANGASSAPRRFFGGQSDGGEGGV